MALLLGVYALVGFVLAPRLVRSGLQDYVTTHYQRHIQLGAVHVNPFTFTLQLQDFMLPDADAKPLIAFHDLLVDLDVSSVWRRAPSFAQIVLDQPYVRVQIRKDGSLNLAELAPPPQANPAAERDKSSPMRLFIDRLAVRAGHSTFEDQTRAEPFRAELRPIAFELRDFSTTERTGNAYALTGSSAAGERFSWSGTVRLSPLASQGRFELAGVQVRTLWSYLRESLHIEAPAGVLGLSGDYDLNAAGSAIGLKVNVQQLLVSDLGLRPQGAAANSIHVPRLEVLGTHLDVDQRLVSVGQVKLSGVSVDAWLDPAGRLNLLDLAGPPAPKVEKTLAATTVVAQSSPSPDPAIASGSEQSAGTAIPAASAPKPTPAWVVSAPDVAVDGLKLKFEDRQVEPAVAVSVTPLNLQVSGFSTAPGASLQVSADAVINERGKLTAKAQGVPDSGVVDATVEVNKLDLTPLQPYLSQRTQLTLLSGQLGTQLHIARAADGALSAQGDIDVAQLRTIDNEFKRDFVKWDRVRVQKLRYRSMPASLKIGNVIAQAPYARVIIASDRTVNISEALAPAGSAPADASGVESTKPSSAAPIASGASAPVAASSVGTTTAQAGATKSKATAKSSGTAKAGVADSAPLAISIGTVRVINGSANFADLWIQPNFAVGVQSLGGTITGLSSNPRAHAKVHLEGKVDRYAPALIQGAVNPFSASAFSDIQMSFKSVEMTTATPYSGHFAGYKIEKGKLSVDLKYHIESRQLKADHRVVIDQLQLGERVESPEAVHLPLRLAVALLKDRNGVIDINLPVTGSLDDPQFRIGPIVWKAVLNLLTKIVTAPFALLGNLFGGGEEMNLIEFAPGSAALDAKAQERLASLVKALQERPQLQLDVPMTYSPELDAPPLASRSLQHALLELARAETPGKRPRTSADSRAKPASGAGSAGQARSAGQPQASSSAPATQSAQSSIALGDSAKGLAQAKPPQRAGDGAATTDAASPDSAALDDPAEHYRLLMALHRAQLGKDAPLPPAAQAIADAGKKHPDPAALQPAIDALQAAALARFAASKSDLDELGKRRAAAIQDVLLGAGAIDVSRVFVIHAEPKPMKGQAVQLELSLK